MTKQPAQNAQTKQNPKTKKKWGIFKYVFLGLLVLCLLIFTAGYYLLNTTSGLKQVITLVNDYTKYQIKTEDVTGNLLGQTVIKKIAVTGENLDFYSEEMSLGWEPKGLLSRQINIHSIKLKNATFTLFPSTKSQEKTPYAPLDFSDIDFPVTLNVENILVENFVFKKPGSPTNKSLDKKSTQPATIEPPIFVIKRMAARIDYTGQTGTIRNFVLNSPEMTANLGGKITTTGRYPTDLRLSVNYHHKTYGKEDLIANIKGELKNTLNAVIKGNGISDFTLTSQIQSLLNYPKFSGNIKLKKLDTQRLGLPDSTTTADIELSGEYGELLKLNGTGRLFHDSPQTDKIQLEAAIKNDQNNINIADLTLNLLTAKQQVKATGTINPDTQAVNLQLSSPEISWPQQQNGPKPWQAKHLRMTVLGQLNNYKINASSQIDTQLAGNLPVTLSAKGDQQKIHDIDVKVLVNQQPIKLTGKAAWQPTLDYQLQLDSASIKPFKQFPGIEKFNLVAQGKENNYQAQGNAILYSNTLPRSDISLDAKGSFSHLEKSQVAIKTLGGSVVADLQGDLQPLDITADLTVKNIQPQQFYPKTKGNISGQIHSTIKQDSSNKPNQLPLIATASIQSLNGKLQGYPLAGRGNITYKSKNQQLSIDDLLLNIAKNKLVANGQIGLDLNHTDNQLKAKINAQHLSLFIPQFRGSVVADVTAKGSLAKPNIQANINANKLAYRNYQAQTLSSTADIDFLQDKLVIKTRAKQLTLDQEKINAVNLSVNGKLSQHQIQANISTPETANIPSLNLTAKGGLSKDLTQWQGALQKLDIDSQILGRWQTAKPSKLNLSADKIQTEAICLQQKTSRLCGRTHLVQQTGNIDITIKNLQSKRFEKLLPESLKIDTAINGKAQINLNHGKPSITGELASQGGKLAILTQSGQLTSKIEQFRSNIALKNNRFESLTNAKLQKLGKLEVQAVLPNIASNNIKGSIKIDNNSLAFIEELVPQVHAVKGKLHGNMQFAGNPSSNLNLTGKITLQKTRFNVPQYGTEIRNLTLDIFAKNRNLIGFNGKANAGKGEIAIKGNLNPASRLGEIAIKGKNFQLANAQKLKVRIDPDLKILFADHIKVRGNIHIPKAFIAPEITSSKIEVSEDVVLPHKKKKKTTASSPVDAIVSISLGDDVRVGSADIETRLLGKITIIALPKSTLTANGSISIQKGALRIYGQKLNIKRGRIIFGNGDIANPSLDVRATRNIDSDNVIVGVNVLGNVKKPEISLFSTPSMPDSSILSYLLFGRPPDSSSFSSTALMQTGGLVGANTVARDIRASTGLDVLNFSLDSMEAGKDLSKKLYVGIRSKFFEAINQFLVNYKVSARTHITSTLGSDGVSVDLLKIIETD